MIYELDKVIEMFKMADKMISENPALLSMSTDEIFNVLVDGTEKMIHVRWGVMTRVKMKELKSFEPQDIINFLYTIEERNLLTEYIGFVLQSEHNISLIGLLLNSYQQGLQKQILPFVKNCIEYEKESYIDQIDKILELIENISDESDRDSFADGYAYLVVDKREEETIFEKYISSYSETLEYLITRIGNKLYDKRREGVEKWLDIFLYGEPEHCRLMGIKFLYRSTFWDYKMFEKYFEFLELDFCNKSELWEELIPIYGRYLLSDNNNSFKETVKKRLYGIKDEDINKKRIFIETIKYYVQKSQDCIEIVDELTSVTFEKDNQILCGLDFYIKYKLEERIEDGIKKLYEIYNINKYTSNEKFLAMLPQTLSLLKTRIDDVMIFWSEMFLYGTNREFFLSLDIFTYSIKSKDMIYLFQQKQFNRTELMNILEGVLLFTFDEKRIIDLVFCIASYIEDTEFFFEYCRDNIYVNYGGILMENAPYFVKSKDEFQSNLATKLIDYHKSYEERIELGYQDKDFMPPSERQRIFRELRLEQNKKINTQAEKGSFFANFFQNRKMKYGKRIAYVQKIGNGELQYNVSEYDNHIVQIELPCDFINNPVGYKNMKIEYLRKRGKK